MCKMHDKLPSMGHTVLIRRRQLCFCLKGTMSVPSRVCWWLKKWWVPVFSTCWRQEGHPASKSLYQLPLMECTFPPLLFFHCRPFPVCGHGGMVLEMYGKGESTGNRRTGSMAVKPARARARVCVYILSIVSFTDPRANVHIVMCTWFIWLSLFPLHKSADGTLFRYYFDIFCYYVAHDVGKVSIVDSKNVPRVYSLHRAEFGRPAVLRGLRVYSEHTHTHTDRETSVQLCIRLNECCECDAVRLAWIREQSDCAWRSVAVRDLTAVRRVEWEETDSPVTPPPPCDGVCVCVCVLLRLSATVQPGIAVCIDLHWVSVCLSVCLSLDGRCSCVQCSVPGGRTEWNCMTLSSIVCDTPTILVAAAQWLLAHRTPL